jgi:hypothetical protein
MRGKLKKSILMVACVFVTGAVIWGLLLLLAAIERT